MWSFQFFFSHLPPFLYHEAVGWYCLTDKISTAPTQMILHEGIWFVCVWWQHWVTSGRALKSWILTLSIIWLLKSAVTIKQVSDVVFMQMLGGFSTNSSRLFGPPPASLCFITFHTLLSSGHCVHLLFGQQVSLCLWQYAVWVSQI